MWWRRRPLALRGGLLHCGWWRECVAVGERRRRLDAERERRRIVFEARDGGEWRGGSGSHFGGRGFVSCLSFLRMEVAFLRVSWKGMMPLGLDHTVKRPRDVECLVNGAKECADVGRCWRLRVECLREYLLEG
jgi:hypothetical protein